MLTIFASFQVVEINRDEDYIEDLEHELANANLRKMIDIGNPCTHVVSSQLFNDTFGVTWSGQILYEGAVSEFHTNMRRNMTSGESCHIVTNTNYTFCTPVTLYGNESPYDLANHIYIQNGTMSVYGDNSGTYYNYVQRLTIDDTKWIDFVDCGDKS